MNWIVRKAQYARLHGASADLMGHDDHQSIRVDSGVLPLLSGIVNGHFQANDNEQVGQGQHELCASMQVVDVGQRGLVDLAYADVVVGVSACVGAARWGVKEAVPFWRRCPPVWSQRQRPVGNKTQTA